MNVLSNIVFLDIDGVLNHTGTYAHRPDCHLDPANTKFLYNAVSHIPDIAIVISSSWRQIRGLEEFLEFVHVMKGVDQFECLVPFLHKQDYCTTRLHGKKRGYEIQEWLSRHSEVTKYICLDDDSDYLRCQPLLQIDREIGFSYTDQHVVMQFFGVNEWHHDFIKHVDFMRRYGTKILNKRLNFCKKYLKEHDEA